MQLAALAGAEVARLPNNYPTVLQRLLEHNVPLCVYVCVCVYPFFILWPCSVCSCGSFYISHSYSCVSLLSQLSVVCVCMCMSVYLQGLYVCACVCIRKSVSVGLPVGIPPALSLPQRSDV